MLLEVVLCVQLKKRNDRKYSIQESFNKKFQINRVAQHGEANFAQMGAMSHVYSFVLFPTIRAITNKRG